MTPALTRNELLREDVPAQRALLKVGGEWVTAYHADPAAIVTEAREHDVRALHVAGKDLSFLPALPDLEHLSLGEAGDITPAMGLRRLRTFSACSTALGSPSSTTRPATRSGVTA